MKKDEGVCVEDTKDFACPEAIVNQLKNEMAMKEAKRKDLSSKIKKNFNIIVVCKNENEQEKTYEKLNSEGYSCKIST